MRLVNRYLAAKIYFAHVGYGALTLGALVFGLTLIPWTAALAVSPMILVGVLFWVYIARIAFPVANELWRADAAPHTATKR
jgi:hypothetical protein